MQCCVLLTARGKNYPDCTSALREEIVRLLEETFMRTIFDARKRFSENNYVDTALFLKKLKSRGAFLETGEILTRYAKGLTAAYELVRFFGSDSGPNTRVCGN